MNSLNTQFYIFSLAAVLLLLFTASCENVFDRQMDEIEKEINTHPSSALERLSSLSLEKIHPESRKARYALLKSLALDKSYIDVTDDSLAQIAVHYYKNHGDIRNKMLAYYSLGLIQKNANNSSEAIISLLRAKEMAERIPDLHYYGLITRNIAVLYKYCYDYESCKTHYQESADAFLAQGNQLYASYSVFGVAEAALAQGQYDYADSLLNVLQYQAEEMGRNDLLAAVLKDRASILISPGRKNPKKVISLFNEARELGFPANNTWGNGILAVAFEHLKQEDSVRFYLAKAEGYARKLSDSVSLYNTLYSVKMLQGKLEEAHEHINMGIKLHNEVILRRENQQLANAISTYSRQDADRQTALAQYRYILFILAVVTLMLLVCVMILLIHNHKQQIRRKNSIILEKEKRIEEDLVLIHEISEQLQDAHDGQSDMARTINELMKGKIAIVKRCADAYEAIKSEPRVDPQDPYRYLDEDSLHKKNVEMKQFLQALDDFRKDDTLFSVLEESVNSWRGGIMQRLRQACGNNAESRQLFSEDDFRILMLVYAGIPDRTIAFLMDMTCSAVRTRKTRYKEKLAHADIPEGVYYAGELSAFPAS